VIRPEVLGAAFGASEVVLAVRRRSGRDRAESHDAGTLWIVWAAIALSMGLAMFFAIRVELGRFRADGAWILLAWGCLAAGIGLRWWAILTLGRFFTVDVAIHSDHRLVTAGPYRWLRHPSYTGVLLAFAGVGLGFGSLPALAALLVPSGAALALRIRVEERALAQRFGEAWHAHARRTWRLLPLVW